jgi:hypothetical protein
MEIGKERIVHLSDVVRAVGESAVGGIVEVGRKIHNQLEEFVIAVGGVEVDELQERK